LGIKSGGYKKRSFVFREAGNDGHTIECAGRERLGCRDCQHLAVDGCIP
jgi:hypothetical protein